MEEEDAGTADVRVFGQLCESLKRDHERGRFGSYS